MSRRRRSSPGPAATWVSTSATSGARASRNTAGSVNGVPDAFLPVGTDLTGNYDVNGPVGGAQGGCNYQTGAWVWGVEVDGAWSSASGQAGPTANAIAARLQPALPVHHQRALARHRPRPPRLGRRPLDVVRDRRRRLVRLRRQQLERAGVAGQRSVSPTRVNKTGWIVGVGTEYALLGGWSVKSEFLYANFGTLQLRRRARHRQRLRRRLRQRRRQDVTSTSGASA